MHESSKRLSQTLKDIYEPDWHGVEDLTGIIEVDQAFFTTFNSWNLYLPCLHHLSGLILQSEDLLWNDYEEKLSDQVVRTMENYTGQFQDVKVCIPAKLQTWTW